MQIKNVLTKADDIEAILSSLDDIRRAKAPSFLFTRIQARLNSPRRSIFENLNNLISRPAILISFLFLILSMDIIVYESTPNIIPGESEITAEDFFAADNFEELLFYGIPDNDNNYISRY